MRESFPQKKRFLFTDADKVADWRRRFAELGPGLKSGISWRAGGKAENARRRTTPIQLWRRLFAIPGVQFINLQYGDCAEDIAVAWSAFRTVIHDWPDADLLVDMDGFLAKVTALDLVISVGNATVHTAGALGVQAWTLLPLVPVWRWMICWDTSIWYPCVRLYRQKKLGQWERLFDRIALQLAELVDGNRNIHGSPALR